MSLWILELSLIQIDFQASSSAYQPTTHHIYQQNQITNQTTYQAILFTNLPTFQPTNPTTYQPTNLPTYQPTNLPTYQPTNLQTYLTYLTINLPTYLDVSWPVTWRHRGTVSVQ